MITLQVFLKSFTWENAGTSIYWKFNPVSGKFLVFIEINLLIINYLQFWHVVGYIPNIPIAIGKTIKQLTQTSKNKQNEKLN